MKIHLPSFLLGFGTAAVAIGARKALRPVLVELGALAVQMARIARAVVERQREHVEDLFADVEETVRKRSRGDVRIEEPVSEPARSSVAH